MGSNRIVSLPDQGEVRFYEDKDNGSSFVALKGPDAAVSNVTLKLPNGTGASGEVLASDGLGGTAWQSRSDWIPVGDTEIDGSLFIAGPGPWFDVKFYGALGNGSANDTAAFQEAIDEASAAGGTVFVPPGVYVLSGGLTMKDKVRLLGAGIRASFLSCSVSGVALLFNGVQYAGIQSMTIGLGASVTHGIQVKNNAAVSNGSYNSFSHIELWSGALTSGQIGLAVQSDVNGDATFNHFHDFVIQGVAKPIYSYDAEANVYSNFTIDTFGTGSTAYAVETYSHAEAYLGFWFGRGSSAVTTLVGFYGTPDYSYFHGIADLGTGSLASLSGASSNTVVGDVLGTTTRGTFGSFSNRLGAQRETALSAYQANIMGLTGVSSDLFQVGVDSVTNGLTIQYSNGTGRMVYTMIGGDLGLTGTQAITNSANTRTLSSVKSGTGAGESAYFETAGTDAAAEVKTTNAAGLGLKVTKTGAGAGALVTLANSGTGNDVTANSWSVSAAGEANFTGGYRQNIDGWYTNNVPGTQSATAMTRLISDGGATYFYALRAGSITGVSIVSNAARSGGTATAEVYLNDASTGLTAQLNGTDTIWKSTTAAKDTYTFVAGDRLQVRLTTASWTPTTADARGSLEIET